MSRRCGGRRRRKRRRRGRKGGKCVQFGKFTRELHFVVESRRERVEGTPQSRSSRHVASQCQTAVVFCRLSAVHCHCQNAFYTLRPSDRRSASCAAHSSSVLPSAFGLEFQTKRSGRLLSLGRPAKKKFLRRRSASVMQSSCFTVPRWHGACRE